MYHFLRFACNILPMPFSTKAVAADYVVEMHEKLNVTPDLGIQMALGLMDEVGGERR